MMIRIHYIQMIMLYKDPNGENVMTTYQQNSSELKASKHPSVKIKPDSSELEEKVAFLERKLSEKEETIDRMKRQMLKVT